MSFKPTRQPSKWAMWILSFGWAGLLACIAAVKILWGEDDER